MKEASKIDSVIAGYFIPEECRVGKLFKLIVGIENIGEASVTFLVRIETDYKVEPREAKIVLKPGEATKLIFSIIPEKSSTLDIAVALYCAETSELLDRTFYIFQMISVD